MTSLELNRVFVLLASRDVFLSSCTQISGAVTCFWEPHRGEKSMSPSTIQSRICTVQRSLSISWEGDS